MSNIPGTQPSPQKIYPGSADANSIGVFDMSVNDTSMYGTYSVGSPTSAHFEGVGAANYFEPDPVLSQDVFDSVVDAVHQLIPDMAAGAGAYLDKVYDPLNGGEF